MLMVSMLYLALYPSYLWMFMEKLYSYVYLRSKMYFAPEYCSVSKCKHGHCTRYASQARYQFGRAVIRGPGWQLGPHAWIEARQGVEGILDGRRGGRSSMVVCMHGWRWIGRRKCLVLPAACWDREESSDEENCVLTHNFS